VKPNNVVCFEKRRLKERNERKEKERGYEVFYEVEARHPRTHTHRQNFLAHQPRVKRQEKLHNHHSLNFRFIVQDFTSLHAILTWMTIDMIE
jgi:hypothetical protein